MQGTDELASDSESYSISDSATDDSGDEMDLEDHSVTRLVGMRDNFEIAERDEYSFQCGWRLRERRSRSSVRMRRLRMVVKAG